MGAVFFSIGLSLDGFIAGVNGSVENPLGNNGTQIHEWMYRQQAFLDNLKLGGQGETGADNELLEQIFNRTGSCIMGKRMFVEGEGNWPENAPFHCPVYVVTHEHRSPWERKGGTTFYFVNDLNDALRRARETAGSKDIRISGGADILQQYLNKGLVDEGIIHLSPVLLGKGVRLFKNMNGDKVSFVVEEVRNSSAVTHLFCKVNNSQKKEGNRI